MLSDEEKQATEWLKRLVKINKRDNLDNTFAEILLNLIEKQSKEIEKLKIIADKYEDLKILYEDNICELEKQQKEIEKEIEKCDMRDLTICYGGRSQGRTFQQAVRTEVKKVLQSLLEKE